MLSFKQVRSCTLAVVRAWWHSGTGTLLSRAFQKPCRDEAASLQSTILLQEAVVQLHHLCVWCHAMLPLCFKRVVVIRIMTAYCMLHFSSGCLFMHLGFQGAGYSGACTNEKVSLLDHYASPAGVCLLHTPVG